MSRKITIVGGGQAGLQLACGLLQKGYSVKVVQNRTGEEIHCDRVDYNVTTQMGKFFNVKGTAPAKIDPRPGLLLSTNPFIFQGEWAERIKDRYILYNGFITNCRLPKPMWIYVFGHELTHALWVWLFGGSVKKFKVTSDGGHVIVDKTNFLIALSPYFFPLYAILVVIGFIAGHLIWNWKDFFVWFHLLIGAAYAFHVTLNLHVLKTQQSDITSQGYLFSAVVIFLGNVLVLLIGLPLLTAKVDLSSMLGWWLENTGEVIHHLGKMF